MQLYLAHFRAGGMTLALFDINNLTDMYGNSLTLYPTPPDSAQSNVAVAPEAESNTYHAFRSVDDIMMDRIQAELAALSEADLHSGSDFHVHKHSYSCLSCYAEPIALVPSLTQALCRTSFSIPIRISIRIS